MGARSNSAHALRLVVPEQRPEADPVDRRAYQRHTLAELPWLREVRLKYGPRAVLIDLSGGGAQLETADYCLKPGGTVIVELAGDIDGSPIPARVVRCHIVGLVPQTVYRSAVEFKRALVMPALSLPRVGVDANPSHEHARLLLALRRTEGFEPGRDLEVMSAILAMVDTPAARRAGRSFTHELAHLFTLVTQGVEQDAPEEALMERLVDRLRRTIPVRAVRVTDSLNVSHGDAIYFDVPVSDSLRAAKLIVELAPDFRFEEWQFHYLKAAAHFFALVRQIGRHRAAPPQLPAPVTESVDETVEGNTPTATADGQAVFNRVVVRYADGRLRKGFVRDFLASRGIVEVWPSPDAPPTTRVVVPFHQLKAIFFVRDFEGDASYAGGASSATNARGRKIAVTFLDGEQLTGVTLTYKPEAVGFLVTPLDAQDNNTQVFVVSQSIRHVQFP